MLNAETFEAGGVKWSILLTTNRKLVASQFEVDGVFVDISLRYEKDIQMARFLGSVTLHFIFSYQARSLLRMSGYMSLLAFRVTSLLCNAKNQSFYFYFNSRVKVQFFVF